MSKKEITCSLETTLSVIDGRWRVLIIRELLVAGTKRFGELQRRLTGVSHRILTRELRALEEFKIIDRKVYQQVPPKVEYSITEMGASLKPILLKMGEWGEMYEKQIGHSNKFRNKAAEKNEQTRTQISFETKRRQAV